ncbi:tetratricopeptide repeat protein [Streptomyces sp. NPDC051243]|uniref:tetratricopeptide repeat protein n=1 Tax=Streptomyces sp. NPDC051243 TaxID=3365646 RepID=UPI0037BCC8AF
MAASGTSERGETGRRRLLAGLYTATGAGACVLPIVADHTQGPVFWAVVTVTGLLGGASAFVTRHSVGRRTRSHELPSPPYVPPPNLPALSRYFTGRQGELKHVEEQLRPPASDGEHPATGVRACVLHGTGGVGKTQLAVAYARRHLDSHTLTWWLPASSPERLRVMLLELAACVRVPGHESENVVLSGLWGWLRDNPGWLLVYDNVQRQSDRPGARGDGTQELMPLLPPGGNGEVLITTQLREGWSGLCPEPIEVAGLGPHDGLTFLRRRIGAPETARDDEQLTLLGTQLGWVPLDLETAGAYIDREEITVEEYLRQLPEQPIETGFETLVLAIERIRQSAPEAEDLLRLCSFLASEDVPRATLFQHSAMLPAGLRRAMENERAFNRMVLRLVDHSLLTRNGDGRTGLETYGIHPRVRQFIRSRMDASARLEWSQSAVRLVEAAFPVSPEQLDSRYACERLMPHADTVITEAVWAADAEGDGEYGAAQDPDALVRLLHRVGVYQEGRCNWVRALTFFEREAELRGLRPEPDGGDALGRATALLAVARQHYLLADLDLAESECRKALDQCRDRSGDAAFLELEAQCHRQMGGILRERIRFDEALEAVQRAMKIYRSRGTEAASLDWAVAEQEVGMIHRNAGRLSAALESYDRAALLIPFCGSQEPKEHTVFRAMLRRDTGIVAQDRGDLVRAEAELAEALAVFRAFRGHEDFETSQVAKFLADVHRRQGEELRARARSTLHPMRRLELNRAARARLAGAEELLGPVLALHHKRRAAEAHKYAACLNKLGSLQHALGRAQQARRTLRDAEAIYKERYGEDHHYRAKTLSRLAPVLISLGRREEAASVLTDAEAIFRARLGEDHPCLVAVYERLAACTTDPLRAADFRDRARRIAVALWDGAEPPAGRPVADPAPS